MASFEINKVFITENGARLKLISLKNSGFHHLVEIDAKGKLVKERRNKSGHVVHRTNHIYSEEIINTFQREKVNSSCN